MTTGQRVRLAVAFVGMTFFWAYFRYQSFFEALFPPASQVRLGGVALQSHACVLLVLALVVGLLALCERVRSAVVSPTMVVVSGVCGTAGAAVACAANSGMLGMGSLVFSGPCVVAAFVTSYLAWATSFSRSLGRAEVVCLALSFFASILLSGLSRIVEEAAVAIAVAAPVVTAVAWWIAFGRDIRQEAPQSPDERRYAPPAYVALFVVFLLVGAVVRGIVDQFDLTATPNMRWPVSLAVAALVALAYATLWGRRPWRAERFAMGMWVALAALFCAGVFWSLMRGAYQQGGQLVVIARSTLDFVFWMLLCETVARQGVSATSVFVRWGLATEVASWLLSYAVVPGVLAIDVAGARSIQDMLVYASLFVLLIALIVLLGLPAIRRESTADEAPTVEFGADQGAPVEDAAGASWVPSCGLSPREMEIAMLFSQGLSIKKISAMLGISAGTVQSHLKGAYRKLEVHSRDELIERVKAARSAG